MNTSVPIRSWLPWLAALLLLPLAGVGCGDDAPPPKQKVEAPANEAGKQEQKKAPEAAKAGDPESNAAEAERLAYSYRPVGKRDPFRSFISRDPTGPTDQQLETPLQKFEIDQFRLVAVIWGGDEPVAMVEDPEGMGHFLRKGVLIGKNWGKVIRITPSEVIVAEEYRDFEGKLIVNEIPLKLPVLDE